MSDRGRETILGKIRKALGDDVQPQAMPDMVSPIYFKPEEYHALDFFCENFTKTKGVVFKFETLEKLDLALSEWISSQGFAHVVMEETLPLPSTQKKTEGRENLEEIEVGITSCESLVARTGSMLISSATASGRAISAFAHIHVVVASYSQVVDDIEDALQLVKRKYKRIPSMLSLTTGPSRTADIEKTLVLGAHGPKELYLFLWNDTQY
ncbi:MAG: LUD domain-containing protein [Cytophagaceae bacterium]|nr:LUD domain-containing protein [Cytophagaceae bacterium]